MQVTLTGLQDFERMIEVQVATMSERIERGIQEELELISVELKRRLSAGGDSDIAHVVKIDRDKKEVYIEYNMNMADSRGRPKKSARKKHNPAHGTLYKYQPFQDTLAALGYEEINPVGAIPVTHGDHAPGIRLTAKMGADPIRRITGGL
jgi:hypothetical protein